MMTGRRSACRTLRRSDVDKRIWSAVLVLLLGQSQLVSANWMYMSMSSVALMPHEEAAQQLCDDSELVWAQSQLCKQNLDVMPYVGDGIRLGLSECKRQFEFERWNCSGGGGLAIAGPTINEGRNCSGGGGLAIAGPTINEGRNCSDGGGLAIAGPTINEGTKETAFSYAITSAGVVHAVTTGCSSGNLTQCGCDVSRQGLTTADGWTWGGCSDNVDYGVYFARNFIDAPDRIRKSKDNNDVIALMNLHNNEAGRKAVSENMRLKCRCHGVSGSCAVKTCWQALPDLTLVGDWLKSKYSESVKLSSASDGKLKPRRKRSRRKAISEDELVFAKNSPNYCKRSRRRGITGTKGRECKVDGTGSATCESLCCGEGYNTRRVKTIERCECKFVWCCEVKCKMCEVVQEKHYCR